MNTYPHRSTQRGDDGGGGGVVGHPFLDFRSVKVQRNKFTSITWLGLQGGTSFAYYDIIIHPPSWISLLF